MLKSTTTTCHGIHTTTYYMRAQFQTFSFFYARTISDFFIYFN